MVIVDLIFKISNNIFFSLGLSVGLISAIEYGKQSKNYLTSTVLAIGIILAFLFIEASIYRVDDIDFFISFVKVKSN